MGEAYAAGRGCEVDLRQAASWLRKAALAHDAQALLDLAQLYLRPDYPARSNTEAARWMGEAAREGLPAAQFELALFYWAGRGVKKNVRTAAQWALRAAAGSEARAYLFLSRLAADESSLRPSLALALALAHKGLEAANKDPHVAAECRLRLSELTALASESDEIQANVLTSQPQTLQARAKAFFA